MKHKDRQQVAKKREKNYDGHMLVFDTALHCFYRQGTGTPQIVFNTEFVIMRGLEKKTLSRYFNVACNAKVNGDDTVKTKWGKTHWAKAVLREKKTSYLLFCSSGVFQCKGLRLFRPEMGEKIMFCSPQWSPAKIGPGTFFRFSCGVMLNCDNGFEGRLACKN